MNRQALMDLAVDTGDVILVNRAHPLGREKRPALREVEGVLLEERTALHLEAWLQAAGCKGRVVPVSGYRTREEQEDIYLHALVEHGRTFTETYVALPGCSEHETGLAVDLSLAGDDINFLTPDLPYDGIAAGLRRLAARYGFVERYPAGKEALTRIGHEPWHFRYVGRPHAALMTQAGMVLEEYCEMLHGYTWEAPLYFEDEGEAFILWHLPRTELGARLEGLSYDENLSLSGNNHDGYILTAPVPRP